MRIEQNAMMIEEEGSEQEGSEENNEEVGSPHSSEEEEGLNEERPISEEELEL